MTTYDEETPGERMDRRESLVLHTLINDPGPWTVDELARDMGKEGIWTLDAIAALDAAGLVHRLIVRRAAADAQVQPDEEIVIATRAARRLDELHGGLL